MSMSRSNRPSWILFLTALVLALSAAGTAFADTTQQLFFIQRSKNANEVHYDARVTAAGGLNEKDPIDAYWLRKASDGSRDSIGTFQKIAYGYDVDAAKDGTYTMKLTALKERPLTLLKVDGKWRGRTTIAGKQAYLKRVYIMTDESGVFPKVLYVDIFGDDVATGAAITEHLVKK
jgi:uncharacterized protein DUF4833